MAPGKKKGSEPRSPQELADTLRGIKEDVVNYLDEESGEQLEQMAKFLEEVENQGEEGVDE